MLLQIERLIERGDQFRIHFDSLEPSAGARNECKQTFRLYLRQPTRAIPLMGGPLVLEFGQLPCHK